MFQSSASPPAAPACLRTPELARAVLRVILAPLIALLEARIGVALDQLLGLMQRWRDGTLPPPPPERPYLPRQASPRPYSAPPALVPSWLDTLFALAASDEPVRGSRPRTRTASASQPPIVPQACGSQPKAPDTVSGLPNPAAPHALPKPQPSPGPECRMPIMRGPARVAVHGCTPASKPPRGRAVSRRPVLADPPLRPPDLRKGPARAGDYARLFCYDIKIN
jgi:hypothetical protein